MQALTDLPTNLPSIDALALALIDAKDEANAARDRVLQIENEIVSIFGNETEGTLNFEGGQYTLQTVGVLNRNLVDVDKLRASIDPVSFDAIVKYKPTLDVSGLKKLAIKDPASYRSASRWIGEKSGKTAVKIKESK